MKHTPYRVALLLATLAGCPSSPAVETEVEPTGLTAIHELPPPEVRLVSRSRWEVARTSWHWIIVPTIVAPGSPSVASRQTSAAPDTLAAPTSAVKVASNDNGYPEFNVRTDPWSDWTDGQNSAWGVAGYRDQSTDIGPGWARLQGEYKIVASPALSGITVRWKESFSPDDGGNTTSVARSWVVRGAQSPVYRPTAREDGAVFVELQPFLPEVSLMVDGNRDGNIEPDDPGKDMTYEERPYRFWINDDNDSGNQDHEGSFDRDSGDDRINSVRDLEDFTRLKLCIRSLPESIVAGEVRVGVAWRHAAGWPALKLWRNLSPKGGTEYLTDTSLAKEHVALSDPGIVQGITPYVIPVQYWKDVGASVSGSSELYGEFLFEGATVGKGELVITLHAPNGTLIAELPGVWLDLKNIKSMYERALAKTDAPRSKNKVDYTLPLPYEFVGPDSNRISRPVMGWEASTVGYPYDPDPAESQTYVVFVHGWRWSPTKANNRAETVFKRLWHLGYRGRFAAFRWPTFYGGPDDGDDSESGFSTFNDSEYRAWKCGESLKLYVNQLPPAYSRNVIAHSLGNVVTSTALQHGMSVANYVMLNAAIPAMCYDESPALHQGWGFTTPNDDPDDGTKALAYAGKLKALNANVVNFFLARDSATTTTWEQANARLKPQRQIVSSCVRGYSYSRNNTPGKKLYVDFCVSPLRYLIDEHESMAFACQSLTKTAGGEGRTGGSVTRALDMDTSFGFADDHGAQWDRDYSGTKAFYQRLLITMGIGTL